MQDQQTLLHPSNLFEQAIEFDKVKDDQFIPAIKEAIELARQRIDDISNSAEPATFENTILALDSSSDELDQATSIYFNLFSAHADTERQAIAKEASPLMSAFQSDITLNEKLFARVKNVYDSISSSDFTVEQKTFIEKTYKGFARNGALLRDSEKEKLREIDQKMAQLGPRFSENVLKDTNAFVYHVTAKEKLAGLPESSIKSAEETAKEKKLEGWAFTLQYPSMGPFLTYADDREARQKIWMAANTGACSGETSNQEIIKEIAQLRHDRAGILGYETHSHFVLEERMAQSPDKVKSFLQELLSASSEAAKKEVTELKEFKKKLSGDDEFMPWDFSYYAEKLKEEKFKFSSEDLRPYFQLEKVVDGVFNHAKKLFQIDFKKRTDLPVYHEDVDVYEVSNQKDGSFVGLFYTDFFPRETKKNGAWMTNYRGQGLRQGEVRRPHVSIVCNFTKPTADQPSLLTKNEVTTLFHEFGHALHSLLSNCTYASVSGTNVYWDFVELPSQINENWAMEKETLSTYAKHYETGELIPDELVEKVKAAAQFMSGYACMRQLTFATLDMAWHSQDPSTISDVESFEIEQTKETSVLPRIEGTLTSPRFSHIFAGGYSSGYYSYKWAEVLDADAFELFKEKGLYDAETAKSFRENILERGGTEHPSVLYKRFRGREPDAKALLRRDGLIA